MPSWVQDRSTGKLVPKDKIVPSSRHHMISPDLEAYESPVDGRVVDGRKQRREDLARSGCRPYEPGETRDFIERKNDEAKQIKRSMQQFLRERFA